MRPLFGIATAVCLAVVTHPLTAALADDAGTIATLGVKPVHPIVNVPSMSSTQLSRLPSLPFGKYHSRGGTFTYGEAVSYQATLPRGHWCIELSLQPTRGRVTSSLQGRVQIMDALPAAPGQVRLVQRHNAIVVDHGTQESRAVQTITLTEPRTFLFSVINESRQKDDLVYDLTVEKASE